MDKCAKSEFPIARGYTEAHLRGANNKIVDAFGSILSEVHHRKFTLAENTIID